jgi:hypothetical protein
LPERGFPLQSENRPSIAVAKNPNGKSQMKALLILLIFVVSVMISPRAVAADAPNAGMLGRYALPGDNSTYFEFRADGTCIMSLAGMKETLTYTVKGNDVTLIHPGGRPPLVLQIVNGVLSSHGSSWPRVGDAAKSAGPSPDKAPPAATVAPPSADGVSITLSPRGGTGLKRFGAGFAEAQMPANPKGYFWVVDRPDGQTKVSDLHRNEWHFSGRPGLYKVHIEYRSGGSNKTVSNVLEVTVPND